MAQPGDPPASDDHDDLIGFASPASLQGRVRAPEAAAPESGPVAPAAHPASPESNPIPAQAPAPEPEAPAGAPGPVSAASIFEPSPGFANRRRREPAVIPGGGMGLYAVYALILFAVPTLGVSAIIGLVAVTRRAEPEDPLSQSHFIYQQRTLWIAGAAVLVGLIFFLVPFGLGPAIMFLAALWVVARGAAGVWALKAGRPIANPLGWWI